MKRTLEALREKAVENGLCLGRKVRVEYKSVQKDGKKETKRVKSGTVTGLYPHTFAVSLDDGTKTSFRYNELLGDENTKVRMLKS